MCTIQIKMDPFIQNISNLKQFSIQQCHGIKWIVECIFSCPQNVSDSMYTTIAIYDTEFDAQSSARQLSYDNGHKFLSFRARPTGLFRKFDEKDDVNILYTTEQKDLDTQYETRLKQQHHLKIIENQKRQALDNYLNKSIVPNTVEYYTRLIYLCTSQFREIEHLNKQLLHISDAYTTSLTELTNQTFHHPHLKNEWFAYATTYLEATFNSAYLSSLNEWYTNHFKPP